MARIPRIKPQPVASALEEMTAPPRPPAAPTEQAEGVIAGVEAPTPAAPHRTPQRNINIDRLETTDDVNSMLDQFSEYSENAGYRQESFEEVIRRAETADDEKMLKRLMRGKPSELLNSDQLLRARQMMVESAESLFAKSKDIARRYRSGDVSDVEMLEYRQQVQYHNALQLAVQGQTREVARALGSLRIVAGSQREMLVTEAMNNVGGRDVMFRQANYIASAASLEDASRRASKSLLAKSVDALIYMRTMGLLAGPTTHAKNIIGNSVAKLFTYPERALTAGVGSIRQNLAKRFNYETAPERAYLDEVFQMVQGDIESTLDALRAAGRAAVANDSQFGKAKISDVQYDDPISSAAFEVDPNSKLGRTLDWAGTAVSVPGRALMGADEFYKTMAFRRELRSQAYRQARSEGLEGAALVERQRSLMSEMDDEALLKAFEGESDEVILAQLSAEDEIRKNIISEAYRSAHYETFTDPLESRGAKAFATARQNRAVRAIVPFYQTLANIMSYAGERSPLAPLFPAFYRNLRAGGVKKDEAIARLAMGVSLATAFSALASEGKISGRGPRNYATRKMWEEDGWQEYSIRIGDEWVSYKGMEPMTTMMGSIADVVDMYTYTEDQRILQDLALYIPVAFAESLQNQTFMVGISDFFDALDADNPSAAKRFFTNFTSSFVPYSSALRTARRTLPEELGGDPTLRSVDTEGNWGTVLNRVQTMMPGWSDGLPPVVDVWGRDKNYKNKLGPDWISPLQVSKVKDDLPTTEMIKNGLRLSRPRPTFSFEGRKINLYDVYDERGPGYAYYEWQKIVGEEKRRATENLLAQNGYWEAEYSQPGMPNQKTRGWFIQREQAKALQRARARFIKAYQGEIEQQWHNPEPRYIPQLPKGHGVRF